MINTKDICLYPVPKTSAENSSNYFSSIFFPFLEITYEVNGAEAPMADLVEVAENLLRVIFEEQVGELGVLRRSFPCGRWHGGLA